MDNQKKKKMMREMSIDVSMAWNQASKRSDCKPFGDKIAEELWDMEYRKFPNMCEIINKSNKEMAEKIMSDLKPLLEGYVHTDTGENLYIYKCKQYGVEIKE